MRPRQPRAAGGRFSSVNMAVAERRAVRSPSSSDYTKGAFTGAEADRPGLHRGTADHGTLFLDEIGNLPLAMQGKLLRVLQDGEFTAGWAARPPQKADVRFVAATNEDLRPDGRQAPLPQGPVTTASAAAGCTCRPCGSAARTSRCSNIF
ncbi:MAG: sigma-54 factor interaction domain-containing protein [Desulfosudis oleivorans]|nr:sigma-54 factor interaction domain-containing protein [Desulfosudis oleivorans]